METPRFKHDCNRCIFLGQLKERGSDPTADIYWCPNPEHSELDTALARYSCRGSDYSSFDVDNRPNYFSRAPRWYLFALIRASQKGLYRFPTEE